MPHNNKGEIYRTTSGGTVKSATSGYVDGDIGVDEADVGIVLGNSSRDTGTLCKASNINKWAKRKPVSFPNQLYKLTNGQLKEINYGLSVPQNLLDLKTLYDNLSGANGANGESLLDAAYSYTKPSGVTLTSPYRLLDFEGYYHGAEAPISIPISATDDNGHFKVKIKKTTNQNPSYQFSFLMNISGSESVIGLMDLSGTFDAYYLCLGVYKDNDGWYVKTASSPVTSSNGRYITLNSDDLTYVIAEGGERTCVIGLCNQQWSSDLVKTPVNSRIFYYPPMGSAASCIGTIQYTATVGPSVSLHPNVVTAAGDFKSATMQIRLGHQPNTYQTGSVTFNLTLTLTSSDPTETLEDEIDAINYQIDYNRDRITGTVSGTIQAPSGGFPINSEGYVDVGSLFRTWTRDLITSGTVTWLSQTYNVRNDGQFVVNEQE